jgi:hypothetical protein
MKNLILYLWSLILVCTTPAVRAGGPSDSIFSYNARELNSDPFTGKRYFGTIKVSTLQVLFSEAPFTFEYFVRDDLSFQFQAGIIFPLEYDSFPEKLFRTSGVNSTASSKGLFSYRNSPYNNNGLSFKIEIRKYLNEFYYAPQLMYKFCGYDQVDFPVYIQDRTMWQTESRRSRIAGVGLMIGKQAYFMKQVTDFYIGAGVRYRNSESTIIRITDRRNFDKSLYPGGKEISNRVYPFFNAGFRLGITL